MGDRMRTLYVLRHGKSDWSDPARPDLARPLADKGRKQVRRLVDYAGRLDVELVVSSPAVRTRQTVDPMLKSLGAELVEDQRLYRGSPEELLDVVRGFPTEVDKVMLVGHMPALAALVETLSAEFLDFPTGGLATVRLRDPWSAAGDGRAEVVEFVSYRDLRMLEQETQRKTAAKNKRKRDRKSRKGNDKRKRR